MSHATAPIHIPSPPSPASSLTGSLSGTEDGSIPRTPVSPNLGIQAVDISLAYKHQHQQHQQHHHPILPTVPEMTGLTTSINDSKATTNSTVSAANGNTASALKRKPSRRANTAERRATHNAVERARRETLNSRFLDLAALLPNLSQIRRPSKSAIVNSSIALLQANKRHRMVAARELRGMKNEADALRRELNEWRDRAGIPRIEEPQRGEGFSVVLSGEVECVVTVGTQGMGMDLEEDDHDLYPPEGLEYQSNQGYQPSSYDEEEEYAPQTQPQPQPPVQVQVVPQRGATYPPAGIHSHAHYAHQGMHQPQPQQMQLHHIPQHHQVALPHRLNHPHHSHAPMVASPTSLTFENPNHPFGEYGMMGYGGGPVQNAPASNPGMAQGGGFGMGMEYPANVVATNGNMSVNMRTRSASVSSHHSTPTSTGSAGSAGGSVNGGSGTNSPVHLGVGEYDVGMNVNVNVNGMGMMGNNMGGGGDRGYAGMAMMPMMC